MMRPRWQKALADILGNLGRSALVVASIAVGLFAVGIIATIDVILQEDMRVGYAAANPANGMIQAGWFDQAMVNRVRHVQGVREAEGVLAVTLRARGGAEEWTAVDLTARRDYEEQGINLVALQAGRWPPGKGEIVLDRNKLSDLATGIGEALELELPSGKTRALKVVGIVQDQTVGAFSFGGGFFLAPPQGYVAAETLASLGLPDRFNRLHVTAAGGGENEAVIEATMGRVRDEMEKNGVSVFSAGQRTSSDHPNYAYVDAIAGVLYLLGLLVVFLSGFLITNTISALLTQQTAQIGIMKTVGARRYQIVGIYMMVLLVFGAAACAISIPLSYSAANSLVEFLGGRINIALQGRRMAPVAVALQVVIAALAPQIAGFFPILRGASIPVQAALSGMGLSEAGKPAAKQSRRMRWRGISIPLLMSIRNVFRRKRRLALTLLTLSLGGAVFIATFNVQSSLQMYIDQVMQYFRADVNVSMEQSYRVDRVREAIESVEGVEYVEPWLTANVDMVLPDGRLGDHFFMLAPPAASELVEPILIEGRWIRPGDDNAITLSERFIAQYPALEVGDTVRLKLDGKESDWVLVGFFQLAGKSGGLVAYTSYEYLSGLMNERGRSDTYRVVAADKGLSTKEQETLGRVVEDRLTRAGMRVGEMTAGTELHNSTSRGLDLLTTFLLIMAGLTALVGSIGLAGTMSLNVMERTREIGVLRAIGAANGRLFSMVVIEGALIGLLSWGIGSLISFPISKVMSDTINQAVFDSPATFTWTVNGFVIWLGIVLALAVTASLLPARNATRLTIREVLAYE